MKKVGLYLLMIWVMLCCGLVAACKDKPQRLTTPQNLVLDGTVLSWEKVENASGYVVCYQSKERYVEKCSYDLSVLTEPNTYTVRVCAKGDDKKFFDSDFASIEYTVKEKTEIIKPTPSLKPTENLTYTLLEDGSGYEVSRGSVNVTGALVIPESYQGLPVKRIGEFSARGASSSGQLGYKSNTTTTSMHLPNTIEEISVGAFAQFEAITEIEIPSSVKVIHMSAFKNNLQLRKVTLSEGLLELGAGVFEGCRCLVEIALPDSLQNVGTHVLTDTLWLTMQSEGLIVNNHVLLTYKGELNGHLEIPSHIKHIAANAFSRSDIVSAYIPDGVTLSNGTFSACKSLKSVRLPDELKVIPYGTFMNCTALEYVKIPDGVTEVEVQAFSYCTSLKDIVLPVSLKELTSIFNTTNNIENIYYKGTEEEWQTNVSTDLTLPTGATVYYYSETQLTADGNYWHFVDDKPVSW